MTSLVALLSILIAAPPAGAESLEEAVSRGEALMRLRQESRAMTEVRIKEQQAAAPLLGAGFTLVAEGEGYACRDAQGRRGYNRYEKPSFGLDTRDQECAYRPGADLKKLSGEYGFRGAELSRANLERAALGSPDFRGASLNEARFDFASFAGAIFEKASMKRASFSGAVLTPVDFSGADLEGAVFNAAQLIGTFRGARLVGASFAGAVLSGVDLSGADLSGAVLTFASASGNLNLQGAKYDDKTVLPFAPELAEKAGMVRADAPGRRLAAVQ